MFFCSKTVTQLAPMFQLNSIVRPFLLQANNYTKRLYINHYLTPKIVLEPSALRFNYYFTTEQVHSAEQRHGWPARFVSSNAIQQQAVS